MVHLDSVRLQIKHEGSSMPSLIGWGAWTWRDGQLSAHSATHARLTSFRPIVQCNRNVCMALATPRSCNMTLRGCRRGKPNYFPEGYKEVFADRDRMIFRVHLPFIFTCE